MASCHVFLAVFALFLQRSRLMSARDLYLQPKVPVRVSSTSNYNRPSPVGHLPESHDALRERHERRADARQVHIMLGGPQEVFVVYSTTDYREQSVVRYGELSGQLFSEALGTKRTYTQRICPEPLAHLNPMPGPPANELDLSTAMKLQNTSQWLPRDSSAYRVVNNESDVVQGCWPYMNENAFYESPIIHTVRLTNLKPSTMYYYSCGSSQSREFSFKMPPAVGPEVKMKVGVWSDVGQSNVSIVTAGAVKAYNADINLLAGDLSYADGVPWRWDTWERAMEPVLSQHLHLFCPGNHDIASGAEQGVSYTARYPSPWQSSGSTSPLWYSIDVGPMHLISLAGQYSPIFPGNAQYAWLEDDLAAVNRSATPWLVAMWHVPWYSSNENHQLEAEPMRRAVEARLVAAGVNLVINGHVHAYERSHPVIDFARDDCGPTYIVIGDGGNYEGPSLPWKDEQPHWSAFREASFGTATLEFESSDRAVWRWNRQACVRRQHGMFDVWSHSNNATYWVKVENPEGTCATEDDNSEFKHIPVDEVVLKPHPAHCHATYAAGTDPGGGVSSQ